MPKTDTDGCKLYLLTPPRFELKPFADLLALAIDAAPDAIGAVQLRLKDVNDDEILAAAAALLPICHDRGLPLIMNDRPDLAARAGCDGVHIGQDDGDLASARHAVGPDGIVGMTCHASRHLAIEAAEAGADYVAFGAFFPSASKASKHHADPEILEWCSGVTNIPCVAIGGIAPENCRPLVEAGANYLAVIGAVWSHPEGPAAAVRAFLPELAARFE
ncbi:MAG: thiamine phosphate synthase [Proteobacteria bacterium]|nr:thiamine phosphate synthase [Pseudomonadota bacterium]